METTPNVSKRRKDVGQSESPIPEEEEELADALGNTDPNANWGLEPNFNLNLNLASPRNPRPAAETSKLHGNKNGKPGAKGAVAMETGKSAGTLTTAVVQRSKIPALSHPQTSEVLVNKRGEQLLKSPNPKHTPALSPKVRTQSSIATSPKPNWVEQLTTGNSPRMTERAKTQVQRVESVDVSNPKPQAPRTLHLPVSTRVQNQKGESSIISPKLANRTPTMAAKTQKPDSASTKSGLDSRTHSSETKLQNQRTELALPTAKTTRSSSLSPKPSTQRKVSGARTSNASGSKENLDSKDSSVGSGSKSSSKAATVTSLDSTTGSDSKASPYCKTAMGSKDSLDSKTGSSSKTSWGSKDSLDSKTGSNSKASPNCKSRMGSRDSLESKAAPEIKVSKTSPDLKTVVGPQSGMGLKDDLDSQTKPQLDSKVSFNLKTRTNSNLNYNSDVLSSSQPGPTFESSLVTSGSREGLAESVSPSSSRTGLSGSKNNNPKPTSCDPKASSDSSEPGPVQPSSKSTLAELSSPLTLSPRPSSASRSPGSGPGKSLGSGPAGANRAVQRSPGSAPGSGQLDPLGTSSPITGTKTVVAGSVAVETNPRRTAHNTSLTRGLTFDSIMKKSVKMADKEEHLKAPETKVTAAGGGPVVLQEAVQGVDVTEDAGWPSGTSLSKPSCLGEVNAIPTGSNISSSRTTGMNKKQDEKKKKQQETGKHKDGGGSSSSSLSPSSPLQPPTHPASSKAVRETATMTNPSELGLWGGERKDVGVQVDVEVIANSSLHRVAPATSSLIGSPGCQSGSLTPSAAPSLCCAPAGQPPFQHVCKIDIELCSQSVAPSIAADKASSLPACLRTYSFQQGATLGSELGQHQDGDVSAESIWEEKGDGKVPREQNKEEDGWEEAMKPQEVAWDKQGMTWEVYGASVDLECLGTAIQTHLESKIREQEKHITTLRKSICSNSSLRGYEIRKRKKRRGGILGCCRKAPAVAD